MKKFLGIVVLGLLWCNVGFSNSISKYERAGLKLNKSLLELMTTDEINENFTLSARDAFFDTNGRILRSENENPERIEFIFAKQNKAISVDKINIVISMSRLELFSKSTCTIFN